MSFHFETLSLEQGLVFGQESTAGVPIGFSCPACRVLIHTAFAGVDNAGTRVKSQLKNHPTSLQVTEYTPEYTQT